MRKVRKKRLHHGHLSSSSVSGRGVGGTDNTERGEEEAGRKQPFMEEEDEEEEARRSWPSDGEAARLIRSGSQRCGSASASLGVVRSLVGKLDTLLLAPPSSPPGMGCYSERVMDLMRLLRDDVEAISSYLDDLSQVEDPPATARCWMNDTRDLSYDMEDYIDTLLSVPPTPLADTSSVDKKKKRRRRITAGPFKIRKGLKWCRNIRVMITTRLRRKRPNIIVEAPKMISEFRMYLQEAIERHHRYELHCCSHLTRPGFLMPASHRMLPPVPPFEEAHSHVVIDGRMNEFINSLPANEAADEQQLKVVSVLGPGCLGKTTLAKVSYDRIGVQFDCRAFVRASKNPDMKRLALDLFSQLWRKQPPDHYNDEIGILIDSISKQLQESRYLIVIDDLRDASVWDIIKGAFPKGNLGSRIVTTTQIEDVALACCGHQWEHVFEMKPLDDDHSRKLFFHRLFGSEIDCPEEFKLVSTDIVEIFGGLPLAIIGIASLLAKQHSISVDLLTHMRDSLSSIMSSTPASERTRQALNLSYNNLPRYLKTCLMYVTMYPEGSIIFKYDLVKQWVAEGFIVTREGESMKKVAGMYFDELVDRRFIQPIHHRYNGEVVSCTVHGVVRDLIAHKSAQQNFTVVVDYDRDDIPLCHKAHRLSLQLGDTKYARTPSNIRKSQVRSLGFFGLLECMPCVGEFKLLRLLNMQISGRRRRRGGDPAVDLTGISELFHLRYLKIASDASIQLPDRMRGLQCLGTLDTTRVTAVPCDIIHLPHLLHLSVPLDTNLLDWIGSMSSSDAVISLWSLGKLHSLQDLHLTPSPSSSSLPSSSDHLERCMEALGSLLGGHGSLKTLVLAHRDDRNASGAAVIICWDGLAPPPLLQRFEFSRRSGYMFAWIPIWMGQLGNLCILKIAVRELLRHGVDILRGLPALTALSLYVHTPMVEWVVFGKQGFSALNYFKFSCGMPWLVFEAGAMPNLQKLKLGFSAPDQDQHGSISIDHLPGLKEISAKIWRVQAADDAVSAFRIVVSSHPSNPGIKVQLVDSASCGDKTYDRICRPPGPSPRLNLPGQYDLEKIMNEQETHDLFCPNCKSCITRRIILRKKKARQTVRDDEPRKQLHLAELAGSEEDDPEKILSEQQTHDLYCSNCNSCITRSMILRKRRRSRPSSIPTDSAEKARLSEPRSVAITIHSQSSTSRAGVPPRSWAPRTEQSDAELLHTVYTRFVEIITSLFPALARPPAVPCHLQASAASYAHHSHDTVVKSKHSIAESSSEHPTTATAASNHDTGFFRAQVMEVITGQISSPRRPAGGAIMDATRHLLGHEGHTSGVKGDSPNSVFCVGDISISPIQAADRPDVVIPRPAPTAGKRDILEAIVYGGLVGSVSSLCVVSGAASCGAKTLVAFMLGMAILIGGLPLIFHHMAAGLRNLGNEEEVEQYRLQLGRRSPHMALALLSYIIFGLLPPVLYGLSFRESDDSENKMMVVAAASLACIALLALGKARVQRRPRAYIKTLMYYLMIAVSSSGLSYAAGMLMTWLLVHFGLVHQAASAPPSLSSFLLAQKHLLGLHSELL